MHAVKRRNRTHEIHNLHKTHRPISAKCFSACAAGAWLSIQLQLFEHFGESQHAQTTEAVLQAGLCLRRSDGKGILQGRRPSEKEFQTAYVPCVRLRCANRTYGGLYLHSMHAVKRRNRTHEIHNLHKTHRPIFVNAFAACAEPGLCTAQLFEHFGESQHAQTTEAVLQAGLLPAQERRKGHFAVRSQAV